MQTSSPSTRYLYIWHPFDRSKERDLLRWLRVMVRLTLATAMLRYGTIKAFPI